VDEFGEEGLPLSPGVCEWQIGHAVGVTGETAFDAPLTCNVREARLLAAPWVRSLPKWTMEVATVGWRFPTPRADEAPAAVSVDAPKPRAGRLADAADVIKLSTRLRPQPETGELQDRLLYLLQPPLESVFSSKQAALPFKLFKHQLEGIAFLMPRKGALLADEMGLGKTAQTILALRLLFQASLIRNALLICPKPLVCNWARELQRWAADLPFEIIGGEIRARRASWLVSNCPLKLVNYEVLTRDAETLADETVAFDVVVLDEAQRIKNRAARTADVVCGIRRSRSWALTGTPIENRPDDLVNIFAFVDPECIPPDTPAKHLPHFTAESILRRVKEDVMTGIPGKIIRDAVLDLTAPQRTAYDLAESEGVVRLNALGATITVHHVFELVMRLKQICNFDPLTGQSAKLEQLASDLQEVAESGRKAIVFSQWVEPLEKIAQALAKLALGPLQYHGRVPASQRRTVLESFQSDARKHVLLMSYGTGSVGLNLQCANYVFLFDRWWNPAVEDQAIGRAHRIGQESQVIVTRFISQGTIEGRIADVLEKKRQLFNDLIDQNGPPPSLGLTEAEIFSLFDVKARPRMAAA
jgi:SNF2 family DNA or RNA helicase